MRKCRNVDILLTRSLSPTGTDHVPHRRYGRRIAGFTLIEIMAAMTVFFMVIGILVSGVAQAMRLAEVGQAETSYSRDAAIRLSWFRDTVGLAMTPAPELGSPLKGSARKLSGVTLQSLNTDSAGPGPFSWLLEFNARTNETELRYQNTAVIDPFALANAQYTAFSWAGSNGRFRYLDEAGNWRDQWPAESLGVHANDVTPPLAVGLEYGNDLRLLVVNIQNRSLPLPSLQELLK